MNFFLLVRTRLRTFEELEGSATEDGIATEMAVAKTMTMAALMHDRK